MDTDLQNNQREWTLVTGAARRVGAEICLHLASKGYNILIHYYTSRDEALMLASKCERLGVEALVVQGDFTTLESLNEFASRLVSEYPPMANLVNNVGNYIVESILTTEIEDWGHLFQTNLYAPIALTNALLPSIKNFKGAIVNLGMVGVNTVYADTYATAYTATKLSLWFATKSYAKALARDGVRVNMVSPGMLDNAVDKPNDCNTLPMGRAGTAMEVAQVVSFLLNKENSYITGQNIEVAGALRL